MATIESPIIINGFLYGRKYDWETVYDYHFSTSENLEDSGYIFLGPYTIVQELPAGFDPIASEMRMLQKSKAKAVEAFQKEMDRHNTRINQLLALSAPKTDNGMEVLDASDDIPF